jgi:zinc transporter ZupT
VAHGAPTRPLDTESALGYLIAVLAAPVAGPILYWALHDRPGAVRLVDGFVYVAVPVLVTLQVLPSAWEHRSAWVVVALLAGLVIPTAMERASQRLHRHTDSMALLVGLSGLLLHTLLEGAALVPGDDGVRVAFTLAVIVHQIPVGLVIWWLLRPRYGVALASAGVGSIVLGTLLGYGLGIEVLGSVHGEAAEIYQAFVSGSLVHVVFHQGRHDHRHDDGHDH